MSCARFGGSKAPEGPVQRAGKGDLIMHDDEIDTERARAGIMLHRMRFVLGFGIAGALVAMLAAWAWALF